MKTLFLVASLGLGLLSHAAFSRCTDLKAKAIEVGNSLGELNGFKDVRSLVSEVGARPLEFEIKIFSSSYLGSSIYSLAFQDSQTCIVTQVRLVRNEE